MSALKISFYARFFSFTKEVSEGLEPTINIVLASVCKNMFSLSKNGALLKEGCIVTPTTPPASEARWGNARTLIPELAIVPIDRDNATSKD